MVNKRIELLELDQNRMSFRNKVINLEFTEKIAGINICNNSMKRDKMLFRLGKKIFKKNPLYVNKSKGTGPALTEEEIKKLLEIIAKI
jgi:hypothetical protein